MLKLMSGVLTKILLTCFSKMIHYPKKGSGSIWIFEVAYILGTEIHKCLISREGRNFMETMIFEVRSRQTKTPHKGTSSLSDPGRPTGHDQWVGRTPHFRHKTVSQHKVLPFPIIRWKSWPKSWPFSLKKALIFLHGKYTNFIDLRELAFCRKYK